jgi:hypothetical protein
MRRLLLSIVLVAAGFVGGLAVTGFVRAAEEHPSSGLARSHSPPRH